MSPASPAVEMSDADIAAFLQRRGHGVLAFEDSPPYAIPVSFGYDEDERRCLLQLVFGTSSRKERCLEASDAVTLVAYERDGPDDWRSVVASGPLTPIEEASPDAVAAAAQFSASAATVALGVFREPVENLDPAWYELQIEEWSGRAAAAGPN